EPSFGEKSDSPLPHGGLVYVIDDEEAVRSTVCRLLQRAGLLTVAYTSAEVFRGEMPGLTEPAAILSDSIMPNLTGYDLLPLVRQHWPHVPMILMSGYTEEGTNGTGSVPNAFLKKPFSYHQLLA